MSKKKAPPFDVLDAALAVRSRQKRLGEYTFEEQLAIRATLSNTGRFRTALLRRANEKPQSSSLPPLAKFHEARQ